MMYALDIYVSIRSAATQYCYPHKRKRSDPFVCYRMALRTVSIILMIHIILAVTTMIPPCTSEKNKRCGKKDCCYEQATFTCCEGFFLQVQNQTTAACVECLAPGVSCYQTKLSCCQGYRCGSGPVVYPDPRPTDRCISDQIKG